MQKGDKMKNTAMARLLVAGMTLALAATAGAMPTKQELAEAQPLVQDLTAEDMRALKAKEKTAIAPLPPRTSNSLTRRKPKPASICFSKGPSDSTPATETTNPPPPCCSACATKYPISRPR